MLKKCTELKKPLYLEPEVEAHSQEDKPEIRERRYLIQLPGVFGSFLTQQSNTGNDHDDACDIGYGEKEPAKVGDVPQEQ